ncbi:MAG: hypothetical protein JXQ27_07930 [Acidobacteria bacterium]|nr:hypothetical protein [Acidobacteriota bacterium]
MNAPENTHWRRRMFFPGTFLFEHVLKRPFLGAVLTTTEQRRWCARHGFSQFGLTNYSVIESFALAIILPGMLILLGWEVNFELPGWLTRFLALSKDTALWIGIALKVISLLDASSRLTIERFLYPRRPRPGLFLGLARLVFYESPHAILTSGIFRRYLAPGRVLGFFGCRYLAAKEKFQRKFRRMAAPELKDMDTPPPALDDEAADKRHRGVC